MKIGKKIFELHLTKLENLLNEATKQSNPAVWLFLHDLRTPLFMLEATTRVYEKIYDSKVFAKQNKQFKTLEDALGSIDYYATFAKEMTSNEKIPATVVNYFKTEANKKVKELGVLLKDENWLNGKRIAKIKESLKDMKEKDEEQEVQAIEAFYIKTIQKVEDFASKMGFVFDNVEEDVHELRRKLRWLSIYPQAFQGVFQYKKTRTKPAKILQKYLTEEIIHSPFNAIPQTIFIEKPILLTKNYFLALSWIIAELGKLKDKGLRIEIIKDALQNTELLRDDEAYNEVYKMLDKSYPTLENILENAQTISKAFFDENNLKNLVFHSGGVATPPL